MAVNSGQENDFSIFFVRHNITLNSIPGVDPLFESGDCIGIFSVEHSVGELAESCRQDLAENFQKFHPLRKYF